MTFTRLLKLIKRNEYFMRKGKNTIFSFNNDGRLEYASVFWDRATQGAQIFFHEYHAKDWMILKNVERVPALKQTIFEIKTQ